MTGAQSFIAIMQAAKKRDDHVSTSPWAGSKVVPFSAVGNTLVKETESEARHAPRRRVLKAGIAASNDRHLTVACTVRDVSTTGARLRAEGSLSLPDHFELIIELDGLEANCEVVWRRGSEVGVRFLGAPRMVSARRAQVISPVMPTKAPSLRRTPVQPGRP
jgi:PilZ domain-containing protein